MKDIITVQQIKAARVMLGLKQKDLALEAGVSIATLNNIERGAQTDPKVSTMRAIQVALESKGIVFINDRGSVGVCLTPQNFMVENATILIIDDSRADRMLYKNWLDRAPGKNYTIIEADNAKSGLNMFMEHDPDCIILDFMMYGVDGFQLLATLKQEHDRIPPILFVTGMHNEVLEDSARSQGVYCYLNKQTMTQNDLYGAVENALKK